MKTHALLTTSMLLGGLLLASCGTSRGDATEKTTDQLQENKQAIAEAKADGLEAWRAERAEASRELRDLRSTFQNERAREHARLEAGIKDVKKKGECTDRIAELDRNIVRIDGSLLKLDASTGTDWSDLKREAREVADDTKNWWDRQKEAVDKKTDADNDVDGH